MNNPTPLDPDSEVDQILADYDIENSKVDTNQPIGKIVLRRTEIVEATKSRLTRMLREARTDEMVRYFKALPDKNTRFLMHDYHDSRLIEIEKGKS